MEHRKMSDYQLRQLMSPLTNADIYLNKTYSITLSYDAFKDLIAGKSVKYSNVEIKLEGKDYDKLTKAMSDEINDYSIKHNKQIRIEK